MEHSVTLTRGPVTLRPYSPSDAQAIHQWLTPDIYWGFTGAFPDSVEAVDQTFGRIAAAPSVESFVVEKDGEVVGHTTLYDLDRTNLRGAIGHTIYAKTVWGTDVNPACKLLLMTRLFEQMGFKRCEFRCDARNDRSAAAIAKLGAQFEARNRSHRESSDGTRQDSLVFSLLDNEWPAAKAALEARLAR